MFDLYTSTKSLVSFQNFPTFQGGANFVPIVVPRFCLYLFSLNSNMFFCKTTSASSVKVSLEICLLSIVCKSLCRNARLSPMRYVRVKTNNIHGTERRPIWQTFQVFDLILKIISVLNVRFNLLSIWSQIVGVQEPQFKISGLPGTLCKHL